MGAVADAALAAGGEVIGVIPQAICRPRDRPHRPRRPAGRRLHARAQGADGRALRTPSSRCPAASARSRSSSRSTPGRSSASTPSRSGCSTSPATTSRSSPSSTTPCRSASCARRRARCWRSATASTTCWRHSRPGSRSPSTSGSTSTRRDRGLRRPQRRPRQAPGGGRRHRRLPHRPAGPRRRPPARARRRPRRRDVRHQPALPARRVVRRVAVGHALRRPGRARDGRGLHGGGASGAPTRWRRPATARWPS